MVLPNAVSAVIDIRKLRDYCLSPWHRKGRHKATVFRAALGWTYNDAEAVRAIILMAVRSAEAVQTRTDEFGVRYQVDLVQDGLSGPVTVRTAWLVPTGEEAPRLTTCYVLDER